MPSFPNPHLDAVDVRILRCLQDDARLSMAELGRRVAMSSPSVTERVRRLESAGVIQGYGVRIDPRAVGLPVTAIVRVRPGRGQLAKAAEAVLDVPAVTDCYRTTGEDCLLITVHAPSIEELGRTLDHLQPLGTTVTSIVVSTYADGRALPLPAEDPVGS